ncbi:MAG: ABC transporter ATP-binding protein [Candidatus Neomarinimicrobiota bacterium]|nr:MAG: ABC transporter ATP-binding protein [Candidatus Neomarinimicrobiota bacterium]
MIARNQILLPMENSIYKRLFKLVIKYWPFLVVSTLTAFIYVLLNSISIWLTASLINNILSDFTKLVGEQFQFASSSSLTLNEKLKYWTNGLILRDTAKDTLQILCVSILIIFILKNVFLYLKNIMLTIVQFRLITELRNKLYIHFHKLSLSFFNQHKSGELTSIVVNDVANMRQALTTSFQRIFVEPINIIAFSVLLFIISWKLALIAITIIPLAGFVIVNISRSIRRKSRRTAVKIAGITNIITETLTSMRVVKAFAMEDYEVGRFTKETKNYYNLIFRRARLRSLAPPITEIMGVFIGVALLWVGGTEVLSAQGLTSEDFIRFILIMFSALQPIRSLSNVFAEIQVGAASAERVFGILDTEPAILDGDEVIEDVLFNESITFDHVFFQYDDSDIQVLQDISFSLNKGSVVALVGVSGAGKSTTADLIPRFFEPTEGAVRLDGVDIRKFQTRALRQLMGIVTQETILFNDTISGNIAYGKKDIPIERIRKAAAAANALEFIDKLPEGFDTIIGEKGARLSGGQRQRLAIARALLKDPPILILDEATSSLDIESEKKVQEAMDRLMKDRTVLVIAHRLSTIVNVDNIIVLDGGKIIETGTHEQLLGQNGIYKNLYNVQFSN